MSAITVESISKVFSTKPTGLKSLFNRAPKDAGFHALKDVSLRVEHGEFFGLLGPNGAGKTTIISILAGITRATHGTAKVCGYDVTNDFRDARRSLGVVPQEIVYDPFLPYARPCACNRAILAWVTTTTGSTKS